jgi:hypothetical protein
VPREVIEHLDVPRLLRRPFLVADGRTVERDTAGVLIRVNGSQAIVTVVIAESGDAHRLGATALERVCRRSRSAAAHPALVSRDVAASFASRIIVGASGLADT